MTNENPEKHPNPLILLAIVAGEFVFFAGVVYVIVAFVLV